jgi:hypothetical protein
MDNVASVIDDELPSVRLLKDVTTDPVGQFNRGQGDRCGSREHGEQV